MRCFFHCIFYLIFFSLTLKLCEFTLKFGHIFIVFYYTVWLDWRSIITQEAFLENATYSHPSSAWFKLGLAGPSPHLFIATIWWMWWARNSTVMAKESLFPHYLRRHFWSLTSLIKFSAQVNTSSPSNTIAVSCHPSREVAIVLNVDRGSLGNPSPSGVGELLQNEDSAWIFGFYGNIGVTETLHAELLALFYSLSIAREKGMRNLIYYSDSLHSILLVLNLLDPWHQFASIIHNILDLISKE